MHNLCLIILATNNIFSDVMHITLLKLHVKLQPHPLKIFWAKVEKVQKTHKLCIIMLINPSSYNFFEKNIFDLQITMERVHPVQISSRSVHCIITNIMWKTQKMMKKRPSLKYRGLVPTIHPEPDFSLTCGFL